MFSTIHYSLGTFGNIPEVDTKVTMNEKSILIIVYNAPTFKTKKKRKRKMISN